MKTLYITFRSNILIDFEKNTANTLLEAPSSVNSIYVAEEPMHVIFSEGEYKKEIDVEKGDLIITFYNRKFPNRIVIVKNAEWFENIKVYREKELKEKELWAADKCCDLTDTNSHEQQN